MICCYACTIMACSAEKTFLHVFELPPSFSDDVCLSPRHRGSKLLCHHQLPESPMKAPKSKLLESHGSSKSSHAGPITADALARTSD